MGLVAKAFQDIITFSRASSGTYVNSNGYITNSSVLNYLTYSNQPENAAWTKSNSFVQQNLSLYSQEADNAAWTKANLSCTGANINAIVAPDGTLTADKVVETTTVTATHEIYQTISASATTYTVSRYFKAAERTDVGLYFSTAFTTAGAKAVANLSAGTVTVTNFGATTGSTSTITNVGDGWYRVTLTVLATAATYYFVALTSFGGTENFSGTIGFGFYTWGAQLVQGSVPGDYRATTSAALPCLYADYNGALRSRQIVRTVTAASESGIQQTGSALPAGTSMTLSVVAKTGNSGNYLYLRNIYVDGNLPAGVVTFDLATGTIVYTGSAYTGKASIVSAGNGFYRCSITGNVASSPVANRIDVGLTTSNSGGVGGTLGDFLYIADAQLNDGSSALAYYDTTASAYNAPRFDYDPVTLAAKGLLVEEQRANLATYSEDFTQTSVWNAQLIASTTPNAATAPDGTTTADLVIPNGTLGQHRIDRTTTITAAPHAWSVFVKDAGYGFTWIRIGTLGAVFDLSTGAISSISGGVTASVTQYSNGWWRCSVSCTAAGNDIVRINAMPTASIADFSGNGTSGIYIWGAQLEAGAFATSYIPTTVSQVTRAADVASVNTLSPWFNQTAGTFYAEYDIFNLAASILGAGEANALLYANNGDAKSYNGTSGPTTANATAINVTAKAALAYETNSRNVVLNAGTVASSTGNLQTVTALQLGTAFTTSKINGHLRRVTYYPRRLTNAELQTLTTL